MCRTGAIDWLCELAFCFLHEVDSVRLIVAQYWLFTADLVGESPLGFVEVMLDYHLYGIDHNVGVYKGCE